MEKHVFFPDRIKSIKKGDKVLEVGPGNTSFYRSDTLLEKRYENDEEAHFQADPTAKKNLRKKIVYYNGGVFPFKDKEFDYVIYSHVLEHIPKNELHAFIFKLGRVEKQGYLEVPLYNFELLNDLQYHLSLIYIDQGQKIHFLSKEDIELSDTSFVRLKNFLQNSGYNSTIIPLNLEAFGDGFEFFSSPSYTIHATVDSFSELIDKDNHIPKLKFKKDIEYYVKKIKLQFNKNHLLSRLYSSFII